jgi:hypothetical protein
MLLNPLNQLAFIVPMENRSYDIIKLFKSDISICWKVFSVDQPDEKESKQKLHLKMVTTKLKI